MHIDVRVCNLKYTLLIGSVEKQTMCDYVANFKVNHVQNKDNIYIITCS